MPARCCLLLLLVGSLTLLLCVANPGRSQMAAIGPNRKEIGTNVNASLRKLAPPNGLIGNAAEFEKLRTAWQLDATKLPVDFSKEFVVVLTASGPNLPFFNPAIRTQALTFRPGQTLRGGPGFGYVVATFNRKDVKTVNGKAVPAK
jgi:hypothetical protein